MRSDKNLTQATGCGKEKKKKGGLLQKNKLVHSFSLGERALHDQGINGYSDIRKMQKSINPLTTSNLNQDAVMDTHGLKHQVE